MASSPLHTDPRLPELYTLYARKQEYQTRIRELKKRVQATHDVLQMEELKCRKRVLRRLGFTTAADIVDMKGRVACEISTGDELLLTELVFNGVFNTLSPEQCAGLLSCFVFTEKVRSRYRYRERFRFPSISWQDGRLTTLFAIVVAFHAAERAGDKIERRARSPAPRDAGDRAADREGVEGVKAAHQRGRLRQVVQGRAHGRCRPVVPRRVVRGHLQGTLLPRVVPYALTSFSLLTFLAADRSI